MGNYMADNWKGLLTGMFEDAAESNPIMGAASAVVGTEDALGMVISASEGDYSAAAMSAGLLLVKPAKVFDKFEVGSYLDLKGKVPGLDAHHVGQKAVMRKFIPNYDPKTAPTILVPRTGHTIRGPNGIVSRSSEGINNARQLVARDIKELRRVYPDVSNKQLQKLVQMNKDMYPQIGKK